MNNKMDSRLTGMWVSFFTTAGIPSDVSATYALTFTENRIQNDMLLDLNKEYLKDMGISRMGDVIAILRHAKQVHENTARDKVLSTAASVSSKVPVAAVTGRTTLSQTSSPASRILEHYTRNPQAPEAPATSQAVKRKAIDKVANLDSQVKKIRNIRFDGLPVPSETKEGPSKTVFARLGGGNETTAVTKTVTRPIAKPVFARLGSKPDSAEEPDVPIDKNALRYEGILKSPPSPAVKNVTITTTKNTRKIFTMRADETPVSVKEKLAIAKPKSVKFSSHVQYKEIEKVAVNTQIFNKPERRLSLPEADVKSRLGTKGVTKSVSNLTITKNVFNRLGTL